MKEYRQWAKKNPEEEDLDEEDVEIEETDERDSKKEEDSAPSSAPKLKLKGALKATAAEIAEVEKVHAKRFAAIYEDMQGLEDNYLTTLSDEGKANFRKMSEVEQNLAMGGHLVGQYFEKEVLTDEEREVHDKYYDDWRESSGGRYSQGLHGLAAESGVVGYRSPYEEKDEDVTKSREAGTRDEALKSYAKKAYLFQQAFFKHIGLKEVTMFRGVQGQGLETDPPTQGDDVAVKTRELSSFSTDYGVAFSFGRTLQFKVPVDRVFGSYLIRPGIGSKLDKSSWGEAEMLVMGASELSGTVMNKK